MIPFDPADIQPRMLIFAPHTDGLRFYFGRAGGGRWLEQGRMRYSTGIAYIGSPLLLLPKFCPVLYALPTPRAERQFLHRVHVATRMINKATR